MKNIITFVAKNTQKWYKLWLWRFSRIFLAGLGRKGKKNGCLRSIQELMFCLANLPQKMKATASQRESEPADQLSPGRVHRYCHSVSVIRSAAGDVTWSFRSLSSACQPDIQRFHWVGAHVIFEARKAMGHSVSSTKSHTTNNRIARSRWLYSYRWNERLSEVSVSDNHCMIICT